MKTLRFYLDDCLKKGYAIGGYNFSNYESLRGICEGCKQTNSPALLCVSEGALSYLGEKFVVNMYESVKKEYKIPLFLHLDHGKSFEVCKKAIDAGFESVMIDASALAYEENVKLTKKVVDYAHKKGVIVEAELGVLAGIEDNVKAKKNRFTDPALAKSFVEKTGCDTLAVAVGTSHGAYKFKGKAKIHFDILSEIEKAIPSTPLVMHGASSVPQKYVKSINQYGGNIQGARGTSESILHELATAHNVYKINTDTDIRLCYMASIRKNLTDNPSNFDMRKPGKVAISEIAKLVAQKNEKVLNSQNKG